MYCFTQAYQIYLLHCVNILFNINYVIIHYDLGIMLICPKWKKINVTFITAWIFFPCCVSIHHFPPSSVLNMSLCLCHYHLLSVTRFFLGGGAGGEEIVKCPMPSGAMPLSRIKFARERFWYGKEKIDNQTVIYKAHMRSCRNSFIKKTTGCRLTPD